VTLRDLIELADEWRTMRGIDISDYGHQDFLVSPSPDVTGFVILRYSYAPA